MPDHVTAHSLHGFFMVVLAAALASVIVLPLIDMVLRKTGLVK